MIYVDDKRCSGCGECLSVCPTRAIELEDGVACIDQTKCQACEACLDVCPQNAILAVTEVPDIAERARVPSEAILTPVRREAPLGVRLAARALPWLGTAVACIARDILPQAASALLDALNRRDRDAQPLTDPSLLTRNSVCPPERSPSRGAGRSGRRRRCQRQGRR